VAEPGRRAERAPEPPTPGPDRGPGRIAIVVDDLGRSLGEIDRLARLGVPVTYAVLPFESRTGEVVARLRAEGAEFLVHLPMEPRDGENPGPGALLAGLPDRKLRRLTEAALDAVPGAAGVNNHMGSRLTADPRAMRAVLEVVARRRLFFLDSRTTAESVAYDLAVELGVPAARRSVFLDAEPGIEPETEAFAALVAAARAEGAAIGIGHPRRSTFELLEREVPAARAAGIEFVPLSFLLERDQGQTE
jgi:polysaccharide deacetylase 2 family uncharacterized protein YibQ